MSEPAEHPPARSAPPRPAASATSPATQPTSPAAQPMSRALVRPGAAAPPAVPQAERPAPEQHQGPETAHPNPEPRPTPRPAEHAP